jgi:gliding motility-associated-like protein
LSNGTYVITCSDVSGCVTNTSVAIAQAPSVTVNSTVNPASCNALCNGSITTVLTQGTLTGITYTYSWLPVTPTISGQGTGTVIGLCANIYSLNLTNNSNCVTQHTFSITQPQAFTVTAVTSSLSCNNVCTGSIVANATGGTGALGYTWTPGSVISRTVTNLCATGGTNLASYTLTVRDQQNCTAISTYTVGQPPALTNSVNVTSPTCYNSCNAVATQTAIGGVSGYTYSWSSGTVSTSSLGGLCGGTYTAFVTDANGCLSAQPYTITPPPALSLTLTPTNPLCNAACNGSIATTVGGAQGTVSYFWTPAASGQNPTNLCATPTSVYTVVATDQSACQVTSTVALINPPAISATVNATNPLCNGNSNGFATVTLSNAIGAINYTWIPTGPPVITSPTVSGLSAGAYTVNVEDANSCQGSQTFTLTNPPALVVNTAVNPANCGQSNGDITANPSGGTPGSGPTYSYLWSPGASTSSFVTGLFAGSYTVTVTDGALCTTSVNVLLNNSSGPTAMPIVSTSITCNGQCTGAASINIAGIIGATPPNYTVTWLAPAPSNSNLITGLCAGIYNAQVEDANACKGFTSVTIAEPPPISNTTSIGFPLCAGVCDGSISVTTSGGNAPYTYTWSPTNSNGTSINNLCAGDYTLMVGYNNGCIDTSHISLPDQSTIAIMPSVTNNTCFGTSLGQVNLTISGGVSPYVAGWSNGQNGLSINNLPNGVYSTIVTDNNGCSSTAVATITSGAQITSTTNVVDPACGLCNGTATVAASGSGPFNYAWSNAINGSVASNLCAGVYQVVISDVASCTQTETIIINNSNGITGDLVNINQIPCSGSCVGAATVTGIGGKSPLTYNWLNPATSGSVISNLCSGTYFVQMVDANGCIRTTSATINPLVTLSVSPFVYLPTCGASDGSISIVIAGGTPTYNIVWNPPAGLTTSLTNLNSGVYSYTVTESGVNSCSISNVINVSNANGPQITANQLNVNCFGQCTGLISTTVTTPNPPLNYLWSAGAATGSSINNLCKGVVTLTVTDGAPCKTIQSFTITDNPLLQLSKENVKNSTCFGDCNGEINLVPSGGTFPYTYTWTNTTATVNPIDSLCDGVYIATIKDSKGCTLTSPSYIVKSASSISLAVNSSSSSCTSVADASIRTTVTGGVETYTYSWQGPSNYVASTQNISNIYAGTYSLSVLDSLGCKRDTVIAISSSITIVTSAGADQIICPITGSVTLSASGSNSNITYQWSYLNNPNSVISTGRDLLVTNITDLTSFRLKAISPVQACYGEDDVDVNVFLIPAVDAGRDFLVPVHSTVTLGGQPTAWGAMSLTWSPAAYLNDANSSNPVASNTINVMYTLMVTDANGCISSDSVNVFLFPELNITTGFTPNGDGKNDFWVIDYIDQFPETSVDIFNRWGDIIYSASGGYNVPFDGKYKGKDLPVGTYYYVIKLNHPGYPKPITGPLTIFR